MAFGPLGVTNLAKSDLEKQLKAFNKKLQQVVKNSTGTANINTYADSVLKQLQLRTRAGGGVYITGQLGGRGARLKALSANYKEHRAKNRTSLGKGGKPNKSSLTFTGQLLQSLKVQDVKIRNGNVSFRIKPTGSRDDGLTNEKLAEYVAKNGRPFLGLTRLDLTKANRSFAQTFRKNARKVFK